MPGRIWIAEPRRIPRLAGVVACSALLIVGLAVLSTNPDFRALGLVLGVLTMIGSLVLLFGISASGWVVLAGTVLGIAMLVLPIPLFTGELMAHQGVRTEVQVTAVHAFEGKNGLVYTCTVRRVDGLPLPHGELSQSDCSSPERVGEKDDVLVDPSGWLAPLPADTDFGGLNTGIALLAMVVASFEFLVVVAKRHGTRRGRLRS